MLKVLIATDGSEHAMRAIDTVAGWARNGCAVQAALVHVREMPVIFGEVPVMNYEVLEKAQVEHQNEVLQAAERHAREAGLALAPSRRAVGFASEAILREALGFGADHIVMGTRGAGAVRSLFIGSVAQRVVHQALVPVTLVK
jgi:nucleotide-binding universal stress UspA family protein